MELMFFIVNAGNKSYCEEPLVRSPMLKSVRVVTKAPPQRLSKSFFKLSKVSFQTIFGEMGSAN